MRPPGGVARYSTWLLAVVVVSAALVTACGSPSGGASGAATSPKRGGAFNYPLWSEPVNIALSTNAYNSDEVQVMHQIFEGLVRYEMQPDGLLKTVPCLAESWTRNADATVWTFKLRRGVTFQAPVGREVTAADVVADLTYATDPANQSFTTFMLAGIKGTDKGGYARPGSLGVEALDRYTVRFTLKRPFGEFPTLLGHPVTLVWPVDYLRKVGRKRFMQHPVGTGPFQFARRVPGESIDLVRNPQWWDTSGGPHVDTLHFVVYGSAQAEMLAFQKGEIDYTWVQQGQVKGSRSLPEVRSGQWMARSNPVLTVIYLAFNMKDPIVGGAAGLRLRQALAYGCDRQAVIDGPGEGVKLMPVGLLPPGIPGWDQVRCPYRYDPVRAAALYKQAGSPTVRLWLWDALWARDVVEVLKAGYAKAGIRFEVETYGYEAFWKNCAEAKGDQFFLSGWMADYPSIDDFLYPLFESRQSPGSICTFYANQRVDALLAKARAAVDERTRLDLYAQAERQIMADLPVIPLYVDDSYSLVSGRVAGFSVTPMGWVDMWRVWVR
jgi:oligopeptide transport system substrate-binding protein